MCVVLSNQRKKRGDFYYILSGPSHKNSSFHFGKKVLFVRRLKHTQNTCLSFSARPPRCGRRRRPHRRDDDDDAVVVMVVVVVFEEDATTKDDDDVTHEEDSKL